MVWSTVFCIIFLHNSYIVCVCVFFFFPSLYLYKLGIAPQIQDLLGKVDFTGNHLPYKSPESET